jgi:signal transduction histidine kinase
VQRYSGKITVESTAGKGTTFRFTLPAATLAHA